MQDEQLDLNEFEQAAAKHVGEEAVVAERNAKLPVPDQGAEIVQLPLWPEPQRAAPSAIFRSALFGVVRRGRRRFVNDEVLAAWKGCEFRYKGERLDQYDLDVWLQALHLARMQDLSDENGVQFTARGFLRALERTATGPNVKRLKASLKRMVACAVEIQVGSCSYVGNLVERFVVSEETGRYVVRLNPDLKRLFDTGATRIEWRQRLTLKTDLAKWLYDYVETHSATKKRPHRISVSRLHELCGMETPLKEFRYNLKKAAQRLEQRALLTDWCLTRGDALEFVRPPKSLRDAIARASRLDE